MRYTLPFGDNPLSFEVSGVSEVREIRPRQEASLDPIDDAFTEIIDAPVGTLPLEEMLSKGDRVLVVCEDDTRPTPIRLILPSLFRRLQTIGIPAAKIRILMAYGLHRPMSRQALAKKLGPEAVAAFSVIHHDAFQRNDLFHVGDTSFGTPVYLNKAVKEADMVIGIGTISLSKEAGYGGGAKIIMPGIAGAETIYRSHAKVADHPNQVGRIRDNPIRKEIEESGKMAGLDFLINTVLNEQGHICRIICGHPDPVFRNGIELFNRLYRFEIPEPFDLLIVGSSPMDMDFYQANKAITASSLGVRDGGAIILASPCWNGISPFPYFDEMIMSGKDFTQWSDLIRASDLEHKVAAEICLGLRYLQDLRKIKISLVSPGIPHERIAKMGLIPYASIEDAVKGMTNRVGECHRIGIVPKGPVTHMVNPR